MNWSLLAYPAEFLASAKFLKIWVFLSEILFVSHRKDRFLDDFKIPYFETYFKTGNAFHQKKAQTFGILILERSRKKTPKNTRDWSRLKPLSEKLSLNLPNHRFCRSLSKRKLKTPLLNLDVSDVCRSGFSGGIWLSF